MDLGCSKVVAPTQFQLKAMFGDRKFGHIMHSLLLPAFYQSSSRISLFNVLVDLCAHHAAETTVRSSLFEIQKMACCILLILAILFILVYLIQ